MATSPSSAPLPPPHKYDSALGRLRHVLFGRPLATSRAGEQTLKKRFALPILSSNALSSNAYATEAILGILILSKTGAGAFPYAVPIAVAICVLLVVISASYVQIIQAYPDGGGAYPVSRDNLSPVASLVAGASLMVDYVLTVAVSIAAGVAAIIAMFYGTPSLAATGALLQQHLVGVCLIAILLLAVANLRGLREAGLVFAIPTYVFIGAIIATAIAGIVSIVTHAPHVQPSLTESAAHAAAGAQLGFQGIGWYLLLQAFSQGCAALTGLEAVSNTVPLFEKPQDKNAVTTMWVMAGLAVVMFFGLTYVADALGVPYLDAANPGYQSVVGSVADRAWPPFLHWMFYVVQISTAIVLLLAANTAFAGFPQLTSMMARDNYLPRQLANFGDRLAFSNGIILLALVACALIVIFHGLVNALLPMYAIGVFIGFTLAQSGMVVRWLRLKTPGWQKGIAINGFGAACTGIVTLIIAVSKFDNGDIISESFHFGRFQPHYGVWIVLVIVPLLVILFRKINRHYKDMAQQLSLERYQNVLPSRNVVLVPVPRLHRGVLEALNYARLISNDARAVYVETDPARTEALKKEWEETTGGEIPLLILESPFRSLVGPLLRYIDAVQKERDDDVVTVVLPELAVRKPWHWLLHNQTAPLLKFYLLSQRNIVVTNVRYFLEQ